MTMQQFLDECKQYPRQYSPEWFNSSHVTIGGSEMEALMGNTTELCKKKAAQIASEQTKREDAREHMGSCATTVEPLASHASTSSTCEHTERSGSAIVSLDSNASMGNIDDDVATPEMFARANTLASTSTQTCTQRPIVTHCTITDTSDVVDDVATPEMFLHANARASSCMQTSDVVDDVATPEMFARASSCMQTHAQTRAQPSDIVDDDVATPEMFARANACMQTHAQTHVQTSAQPTVTHRAIVEPCPARKEISIYDSGVPMGWGTMFEPLLCSYVERRANLVVKGRSISYMPGPFRYSPDGLFEDHAGDCAILELKNPFTRVWQTWSVGANDQFVDPHLAQPAAREVPPQYVGQLQLGLHLIKCAKYAYFVEAVYRRATMQGRVSAIKMQSMAKVRDARVIESGIIGFYHACTGDSNTYIDLKRARDSPINFSSRTYDEELCYVLTHLRDGDNSFYPRYFQHIDGVARAHSSVPYTSVSQMPKTITMSDLDDDEDADDGVDDASGSTDVDEPKNLYLIGYMPWNLIGVHTVRVDRDPSYISDTIVARAKEIVNAITLLRTGYE